jgi:hypothetical protein
MKKTTVLTLALLFVTVLTQAQTEKTLKLYMNGYFNRINYQQTSGGTTIFTNNQSDNLIGFTPAIMINRESGRYTEWELSTLRINRHDHSQIARDSMGREEYLNGAKNAGFSFSGRYEYGFNLQRLLGMEPEKFFYSLGLGAQPSVNFGTRRPYTSDEFRRGNFLLAARVDIIPRIMYTGKGKWFIDINCPISMLNGNVGRSRTDNPSLPLENQRYWIANVNFFPLNVQPRIGIGMNI